MTEVALLLCFVALVAAWWVTPGREDDLRDEYERNHWFTQRQSTEDLESFDEERK